MSLRRSLALSLSLLLASIPIPARAETATVAVAANFVATLSVLAVSFRKETGHELKVVPGSTGKLYAQIREGAPFDVLLAADQETPRKLATEKLSSTPFSYAIGSLVLWSKKPGYVDAAGQVLESGNFRRLALANPEVAPYGRAARQFLTQANLWMRLSSRFALAENVAQAYQFIDTENAELGFVALSQVLDPARPAGGSYWIVPDASYAPLVQDAVLLEHGTTNVAARRFLESLRSSKSCELIQRYGYRCPRQER